MTGVVSLVTGRGEAVESVREIMRKLLAKAEAEDVVGMACVLIRRDGAVFVTSKGNGNRTMLLGAVADLQYTLAKDGDHE